MTVIRTDEPLAIAIVAAIREGDLDALRRLLHDNPGLATARLADPRPDGGGGSRTLLHVVADWPGHFPNGAATVRMLVEAGADVDARFRSSNPNTPHAEAPLHWAASADDVDVLDALIDAGADIEASGAVIAGGTPLDDAVAFGQWRAARRLVECGAKTAVWHAAALGLMDRMEQHFAGNRLPAPYPWGARHGPVAPDEVVVAFWCACHGGQRRAAQRLLQRGADLNWRAVWDGLTPLDAARRSGADDLVEWLRAQGARSATELG